MVTRSPATPRYLGEEDHPILHTNHFTLQAGTDGFVLTLGQSGALDGGDAVRVVGRFAITPARLAELRDVLTGE